MTTGEPWYTEGGFEVPPNIEDIDMLLPFPRPRGGRVGSSLEANRLDGPGAGGGLGGPYP